MRILQVVQRPQRRGAEIFAHQLSRQLVRLGHDTHTVYLYPYTGELPLEPAPGDLLLNADERRWTERLPGVDPGLLRRLKTAIDRFQPDIVQVNGARTVKYGAFAKRLRIRNTWRLVYRNIDNPAYWVQDSRRRWFYRTLVMPQVDGTVGVSQATLNTVVEMYGLRSPVVAIPNGIDTDRLDHAPSAQDAREQLQVARRTVCLLFAGSLTVQKRPDRFVRLIARLRNAGLNVDGWLIGDGPLRPQLQRLAQELDLGASAHFVGYADDVGLYMRGAGLLVVTSDSDGIPAVVLESAYLGTPAVATNVGGLAECIVDGETGILVPAGDEEALAVAVTRLLGEPELRDHMGACARAWVHEHFTMKNIAEQYLEFYKGLPVRRAQA